MNKSFTLIELLIVIAIIAIIAVGIIILTIPGQRLAQARDTTRAAHLKNLETALYLYDLGNELSNLGITENLTEICNTELGGGCTGLIDLSALNITIPIDPLGGNSLNGTGYYVALVNNKLVLYSNKAETKPNVNIGGADGFYLIFDWHDLNNIRNNLSANYLLANSIDENTNGYDDYNTGAGWEPIGDINVDVFTGIFNGNNYIISDLYINKPDISGVGLFGFLGKLQENGFGEIKNIGLVNNNIVGASHTGGLVGYNIYGFISNSYNTGTVSGTSYSVGGLVGRHGYGDIDNSYNTGNITGESFFVGGIAGLGNAKISNSYNTGNIIGYENVGGVVGVVFGGKTIEFCYNEGNISGNEKVGGVVGHNDGGEIYDSYNTGEVFGDNPVWSGRYGGLVGFKECGIISRSYSVGYVSGDGEQGGLVGGSLICGAVVDSYWDIETSNQLTSDAGEPRTTAQMRNILNYTDPNFPDTGEGPDTPWDIIEIQNHNDEDWYINNNNDYPRLGWQ